MGTKKGRTHFGKEIINDVLEMKSNGKTNNEIAKHYGMENKKVITNLITRYNRNKDKMAAGIVIKRGRPPKDCRITEEDKLAELRYKLTRKEYRIKQLERENELMRNFLKETGRK